MLCLCFCVPASGVWFMFLVFGFSNTRFVLVLVLFTVVFVCGLLFWFVIYCFWLLVFGFCRCSVFDFWFCLLIGVASWFCVCVFNFGSDVRSESSPASWGRCIDILPLSSAIFKLSVSGRAPGS